MRVLILDPKGQLLPLAISLVPRGHEVRYWPVGAYGDGFVEQVAEWRPHARWADLIVSFDDPTLGPKVREAGRLVLAATPEDPPPGRAVAVGYSTNAFGEEFFPVEVTRWWNGKSWVGPMLVVAPYEGAVPERDGPEMGFLAAVETEPTRLFAVIEAGYPPTGPYRGPVTWRAFVWEAEVAIVEARYGLTQDAGIALSEAAMEDPLRWFQAAAVGLLTGLRLHDGLVGAVAVRSLATEPGRILPPPLGAMKHLAWYAARRGQLGLETVPGPDPVVFATARGENERQVEVRLGATLRQLGVPAPLWRQDRGRNGIRALEEWGWLHQS